MIRLAIRNAFYDQEAMAVQKGKILLTHLNIKMSLGADAI